MTLGLVENSGERNRAQDRSSVLRGYQENMPGSGVYSPRLKLSEGGGGGGLRVEMAFILVPLHHGGVAKQGNEKRDQQTGKREPYAWSSSRGSLWQPSAGSDDPCFWAGPAAKGRGAE